MLKLKYLYENYELAKLALENWDYDTDTIDAQLQQFRISSNAIYPFTWHGNRHFLRLSPAAEKNGDNLEGELEFLCYLQQKNYPAAVPVASNSGELVVTLDSPWGKYYASVFYGVEGIPIEDTDCNDHIMQAYGQALGKLHILSAAYLPEHKKWTCQDALLWIAHVLKQYDAPDKMLTEAFHVRKALEQLPQTTETFGLVHYDFEPDNVFWDENSQSCAVIDFEDSMYHFFLADLDRALEALSEIPSVSRRAEAKRAFLQGYQSIRKSEPDSAEKLKLMRRFCNLYSYARLIRCVAGSQDKEPDWMIALREKLHQKIKHLENEIPESIYTYD